MFFDRRLHTIIEDKPETQPEIRRLADGSIDYTHYDARARQIRSQSLVKSLKGIANRLLA